MKHTNQNAAQIKLEKKLQKQDALERLPIEGKFGQGKNGYSPSSSSVLLSDKLLRRQYAMFSVVE
ncbi:MAG: hypothetical protein OEL83_15075 [Desulforhopalus sp.]|nr:hypothetical protein [Desulforhopalus sp.]